MASVTFKNLNKTYPNGFISVKNVSLHIKDGEFVAFHGPSGCGKSTILRMIGGLEERYTWEMISSMTYFPGTEASQWLFRTMYCIPILMFMIIWHLA